MYDMPGQHRFIVRRRGLELERASDARGLDQPRACERREEREVLRVADRFRMRGWRRKHDRRLRLRAGVQSQRRSPETFIPDVISERSRCRSTQYAQITNSHDRCPATAMAAALGGGGP